MCDHWNCSYWEPCWWNSFSQSQVYVLKLEKEPINTSLFLQTALSKEQSLCINTDWRENPSTQVCSCRQPCQRNSPCVLTRTGERTHQVCSCRQCCQRNSPCVLTPTGERTHQPKSVPADSPVKGTVPVYYDWAENPLKNKSVPTVTAPTERPSGAVHTHPDC